MHDFECHRWQTRAIWIGVVGVQGDTRAFQHWLILHTCIAKLVNIIYLHCNFSYSLWEQLGNLRIKEGKEACMFLSIVVLQRGSNQLRIDPNLSNLGIKILELLVQRSVNRHLHWSSVFPFLPTEDWLDGSLCLQQQCILSFYVYGDCKE